MSDQIEAVALARTRLESILKEAKKTDLDQLRSTPGRFFGSAIGIYTDLLVGCGSKSFAELTSAWKSQGNKNLKLAKEIDELWSVEDDWERFLNDVDTESRDVDVKLTPGYPAPADASLVDVRSGSTLKLEDLLTSGSTEKLHLILLRHFA